jgi:RNA polymerase sigma-70 factor, ECF subfamily
VHPDTDDPLAPPDNEQWLADLRATGPRHEAALARLREYLLRAVLVYLTRHRSDLAGYDFAEVRQFAEDWTQQALIQVVASIDRFRGDSRFTTWAYRIAVNLVAGELRRKRWDTLSLDEMAEKGAPEGESDEDNAVRSPESEIIRRQIWATIQHVIDTDLTARQRDALTQIVLDGVPVEVVAARLATNRNNIYKLVHDARKKLRRELEARHWTPEEMLAVYGDERDA